MFRQFAFFSDDFSVKFGDGKNCSFGVGIAILTAKMDSATSITLGGTPNMQFQQPKTAISTISDGFCSRK